MATNYGRGTYVAWDMLTLPVIDIDTNGLTAITDAIEITKYGNSVREYTPGYTDYGSLAVTIDTSNFAIVDALRVQYEMHTIGTVQMILPTGLNLSATAFMTQFMHSVEKHGMYVAKIVFKLSGTPVADVFTGYNILPPAGTSFYRGGSYPLYLTAYSSDIGSGGMAGTNATWSVVGQGHVGVSIQNNILRIEPTAQAGNFQVQAIISPTPGKSASVGPIQYTIVVPQISAIDITGGEDVLHVTNAQLNAHQSVDLTTFAATAYPLGADNACTWKLYRKDAAGAWNEMTQATFLEVTAEGKIVIYQAYPHAAHGETDVYDLKVEITSTVASNIKSTRYIALEVASA